MKALLYHLETSWNLAVKRKFLKLLESRIELIRTEPELFRKSDLKVGLHQCVISRQTSLYYMHDPETVTILTIFDNRQNPKTLREQIEKDET